MKVSCIIPAYNEEQRISSVISAVLGHHLIDEIVVVNDASSDDTRNILERMSGITLINHEINKGKTQAVLTGIKMARNDYVVLIDSDLIGLSKEALTALIEPVTSGNADMTISLRKNALGVYKMLGVDFVSGERVFHRDVLLEHEEKLKNLPGFGLEVFKNNLIIAKKMRLQIVHWKEVISPRKSVKMGFFAGSIGDFKMILQILKTVSLTTVIYQMYMMRKLSRAHNRNKELR